MIYRVKRLINPGSSEYILFLEKSGQIVDKIELKIEGKVGMWEPIQEDEIVVFYRYKIKSFKLDEFGISRKYQFFDLNPIKIAKVVVPNFEGWQIGEEFTEKWKYSKFDLTIMKVADYSGDDQKDEIVQNEEKISFPTFNIVGDFKLVPDPKKAVEQFVYLSSMPDTIGLVVKKDSSINYFDTMVGLEKGVYLMTYTRF